MNTLNRVLLGLFGLQLLLGLWVCTRGGGPTLHKATALLADVDAEEVSKVQIFGPKEARADVKPDIVLSRETDGWVLASHHDYPADAEAVKGLIGKLAAMKSRGPQTNSRSRHAQLEVAADKYQRKLVVSSARGEHTVYLGSSPAFRQVSVRIDDEDATHAVSDITTGDADTSASAWIDPTFLELPVPQMQTVTIEAAGGTLALARGADLQWQLGGGPVDQAKVEAMLGKLARIDIADIAGVEPQAAWGLDRPQARVTVAIGDRPPPPEGVDTADEPNAEADTYVVEVGAEQDGRYYVRALHKKHIVRVDKAALEEVVGVTPEKLGASAPPAPDGEAPPAPGAPAAPKPATPAAPKPATPAAPRPATPAAPRPATPAAPKPATPAPRPATPAPKPATP